MKTVPPSKLVGIITGVGLMIFLLLILLIFGPLTANVPQYNIVDFEFAWTADRITLIFDVWGQEGMKLHEQGVYWDFLFILGYVSLISGGVLLLARKMSGKAQKIGYYGYYVSFAPLIAGLFDIIENLLLLSMLTNPEGFLPSIPLIAGIMAAIKFGFFILGIVYLVVEGIIWIQALLKK